MNKLSLEQANKLFELFNSNRLGEIARQNNWIGAKQFRILTRIARNCSLEEFQKFCVDLEIPSLQLTPQEQEYVRGGWSPIYGFLLDLYLKALGVPGK